MHQGLFDGALSGVQLTSGGQDQAAPSRTHCQHPRPVTVGAVVLESVDQRFGLIDPAQSDQCLDRVWKMGARHDLGAVVRVE